MINVGNDNFGAADGGLANGVTQIGNDNLGAAAGVLSNVTQIGNDNHGTEKINFGTSGPAVITVPVPNVAAGLGAENLVVGNGNEANAYGNLVSVNTFGNDNKHNVTGSSQLPGGNLLAPEYLSTVSATATRSTPRAAPMSPPSSAAPTRSR